MKVAVTAVNGKLGSVIAKRLITEIGSANVVGFARTPEKAKHLGIEIRKGDYNSPQDFEDGLKGIDRLLIISGMDAPTARVQQHRNIIKAAKHNGVEKVVYTSIIGHNVDTVFGPVVQSNRQTERDLKSSGLSWAVGRNGLYLEPDLEYLDSYLELGYVSNSALNGKTSYTSKSELAEAYTKLLLSDQLNSAIYNLTAEPVEQKDLVEAMNQVFEINLKYLYMTSEAFLASRQKELGTFMGAVIGGIYDGIRDGSFETESDFEKVTGRAHKQVLQLINEFKNHKS
ncbi:MAG: NAD(P)H-binding protein [Flavobacteriales bacterium]